MTTLNIETEKHFKNEKFYNFDKNHFKKPDIIENPHLYNKFVKITNNGTIHLVTNITHDLPININRSLYESIIILNNSVSMTAM